MFAEALLAALIASQLPEKGVYAVAFSYPVAPQGKVRIRVPMSAAHTRKDLDFAINAFCEAREEIGNSRPRN